MEPLLLEYDGRFYPYVIGPDKEGVSGIYVEMWRMVAESLWRELILSREIKFLTTNLRTTTRLDGSQLSPETLLQFYTSFPIRYSSIFFAERERSEDLEGSELTFFTVFRFSSLLLLEVAYILCSLCTILLNNGRNYPVSKILRQLVQIIFLLALTMVVYHCPLQSSHFLLTDHSLSVVSDSVDILRRMCIDPSVATLLHSGCYAEINLIEEPCTIAQIKPTEVDGKMHKDFNSYSQIVPSYYLLSKSTHINIKYALNRVILRIFPPHMIDGFWTIRMARRLRNFKMTSPSEIEYSSMTLLRLSLIFYILLVLLSISLTVFIVKVVIGQLLLLTAAFSRMKFLL